MSNALNSFVSYLADGNTVTSRQVRAMFKVDNAADLAYRARNEGISVYTNRTTLSDGTIVTITGSGKKEMSLKNPG